MTQVFELTNKTRLCEVYLKLREQDGLIYIASEGSKHVQNYRSLTFGEPIGLKSEGLHFEFLPEPVAPENTNFSFDQEVPLRLDILDRVDLTLGLETTKRVLLLSFEPIEIPMTDQQSHGIEVDLRIGKEGKICLEDGLNITYDMNPNGVPFLRFQGNFDD